MKVHYSKKLYSDEMKTNVSWINLINYQFYTGIFLSDFYCILILHFIYFLKFIQN